MYITRQKKQGNCQLQSVQLIKKEEEKEALKR